MWVDYLGQVEFKDTMDIVLDILIHIFLCLGQCNGN